MSLYMFTKIDYHSKVPIYVQIMNQIKYMVATDELKTNERLPSVRDLAALLKVNPTSVARVYRDLESEGVISTKRGSGSYISENVQKFDKNYRFQTIQEEIRKLIALSYQMGFSQSELASILEEELRKIN
jgi:GntR family transcriptional regulator